MLATVQATIMGNFTKLGTTDKVACRTEDDQKSFVGGAFWQATSIDKLEKCATLCLEMLRDCQGIEYEEMSAGHGRCEIWIQKVKGADISFQNNISCYSLDGNQSGIVEHFVSWHVKIQGLSNEAFNRSTKEVLTSTLKSQVAKHLSNLPNRTNIDLTAKDVDVLIRSCEEVVIIITQPEGTNPTDLVPIYEALSWYTSGDNSNQGSQREVLKTDLDTALAHLNITLDDSNKFPRMIDKIINKPTVSSPSPCVLGEEDDKTVKSDQEKNGVHGEGAGVLTAIMVTASLSFQ